jgi:ethanolaminephosphotransferase
VVGWGIKIFSRRDIFILTNLHETHQPKFDRLVLIVIDALRSSFVFDKSSNMTFVNSLINAGHAVPFTAYAHPPTVTLPRIKVRPSHPSPVFVYSIQQA